MRRELARLRAAEALGYMRGEGSSLTASAHRAHTTRRTIRRHFPGTLRRGARGRWWIARGDRQPFDMRVVGTEGPVVRTTRGSQVRSLIGAHHQAIKQYLGPEGGDPSVLEQFRGKRLAGVELETDPDRIEEIWRRGQLDFLEIYAVAG